jgi:hypothetical protein
MKSANRAGFDHSHRYLASLDPLASEKRKNRFEAVTK